MADTEKSVDAKANADHGKGRKQGQKDKRKCQKWAEEREIVKKKKKQGMLERERELGKVLPPHTHTLCYSLCQAVPLG